MEARTETLGRCAGSALDRLPGLGARRRRRCADRRRRSSRSPSPAATRCPSARGPPVEELAVERTVLEPNRIELTVRNTGPDPVEVAQVFVNDAYVDFEASARADRPARAPTT